MPFATRFNRGKAKGVKFDAPSLCQRQFKDSCSIESMMRRALLGDRSVLGNARYLDVVDAPESYHDAVNIQARAESVWNDLPEALRVAYGSPAALVADVDRRARESAAKSQDRNVSSDEPKASKPSPTQTT